MTVNDILKRFNSDAYVLLKRYSAVLDEVETIDTRWTTAEELMQHSVFNDCMVADVHVDYTDSNVVDLVTIMLA